MKAIYLITGTVFLLAVGTALAQNTQNNENCCPPSCCVDKEDCNKNNCCSVSCCK